jgi:hypothetical protein
VARIIEAIIKGLVAYFAANPDMISHFTNQLLDQVEARQKRDDDLT